MGKKPSGGRPSKEYRLTLDMAKELSMLVAFELAEFGKLKPWNGTRGSGDPDGWQGCWCAAA